MASRCPSVTSLRGPCDSGRPVLFGHNAYSSCVLRISGKELSNCTALRDVVLRTQERLVRAEWAARGGDRTNLTSADAVLPILFDRSHGREEDDGGGLCVGVPLHLSIHVLYEDTVSGAGGGDLSASFFLVGVAISVTGTSWRLTRGAGGLGENSERLLLSSSITFTQAPSAEERSCKRFWLNLSKKNSFIFALQNMNIPRMDMASGALLTLMILVASFLLCHQATRGCNSFF
ncbi:tectonic-2-like [Hetaerina americana]|uniref:tectonic-2-like n=1 Tax=Hetaerina americana TaxID=62018 RepID=UPI003A7F4790